MNAPLNEQQLRALSIAMAEGISAGNPDVVAGAIRMGGNPDLCVAPPTLFASSYSSHKPPLHWAVLKGDIAAIETIVGHGGNIDATDSGGLTALSFTIKTRPNYEVLRCLIRCGANVLHADNSGQTPIDCAKNASADFRAEIFKIIIAENPAQQMSNSVPQLLLEEGKTEETDYLLRFPPVVRKNKRGGLSM